MCQVSAISSIHSYSTFESARLALALAGSALRTQLEMEMEGGTTALERSRGQSSHPVPGYFMY